MLSRAVNQVAQSPWARLVWTAIAVLALIQMVAFYSLCTSQVERARAREHVAVEQRNAQTDCLDSLRKSTISSCARLGVRRADADAGSLAVRDMPQARPTQTVFSGAVPVSYVFH